MKMILWFLLYIELLTAVQGVYVQTYEILDYEAAWDVSGRKDFKFKVNGPRDALLSVTDGSANNGYEIIIGGNGNSFTSLRPCVQCNSIDSTKVYSSPLSNGTLKEFWIKWSDTTLGLGEGYVTGDNLYFQYENMSRIMPPQKIFISAFTTSRCLWEIPDYQILVTPYLSPLTFSYYAHWNVAGVQSAKFSIKTCGTVNMFLHYKTMTAAIYTINIGFCGSQPCTKINGRTNYSIADINPFSCSNYVPIWLVWGNHSDIVSVGIGNQLHENTLVSYANASDVSEINGLVISTTTETRWKSDVYGCDFTSWEEWSSWSKCGPEGRSQTRNRVCVCETPPTTSSFDEDFYCDGHNVETIFDFSVECQEWKFIDHHSSSSLSKFTIEQRSKIKCAMICQLQENCEVFSYNVSSKECFLYHDPYDETLFTSPGALTYDISD